MSEKINTSIELCQNPNIYRFDSLKELVEFENQIALEVCPNMDNSDIIDWQKRVPIYETLRPIDPKTRQDFNGQILNIQLSEIPDAYDRLYDATERGLKFGTTLGKPNTKHADDNVDFFKQSTKGFYLSADAKSTGIGIIGEVNIELYYLPTPIKTISNTTYFLPGTNCIRRYTTRPMLERNESNIFDEDSARIIKEVGRRATSFNVSKLNNTLRPQ